jgi:hypothetical protein
MGLNNDDIKALIAILQKGLQSDSEEDDEDDNPTQVVKKSSNKKKSQNKAKPKRVNNFLHMKEKDMHKSDIAIDKKLNKFPPTERSRVFEYLDVKCRICGREERVSPTAIDNKAKERYKCNRCATSAG